VRLVEHEDVFVLVADFEADLGIGLDGELGHRGG
jgi:hypothetical protein